MHATLIRALASLENHDTMETHRLLAVLRGMIEGAIAEAQHGRWWRRITIAGRPENQRSSIQRRAPASTKPMITTTSSKTTP